MINYISDDIQLLEDSVTLAKVLIDVITDNLFSNASQIKGEYSTELNALVEAYRNYILLKKEVPTKRFTDLQDKVYGNGNDFQ